MSGGRLPDRIVAWLCLQPDAGDFTGTRETAC